MDVTMDEVSDVIRLVREVCDLWDDPVASRSVCFRVLAGCWTEMSKSCWPITSRRKDGWEFGSDSCRWLPA